MNQAHVKERAVSLCSHFLKTATLPQAGGDLEIFHMYTTHITHAQAHTHITHMHTYPSHNTHTHT